MQETTAGKRRILLVITSLQVGGAETQVASLACVLQSRGWDVAVVCLLPASGLERMLTLAKVQVRSLGMKRGWPDPRAILRLAAIVRDWKPDIVHSHMVHANLLARCTRLVASMPALISTAHNTLEKSERGGPTWYKEQLYRLTDKLADQTTIICQAGKRHYIASGAVPAHRLEVVPIGIDCQQFSPRPDSRAVMRQELGLGDGEFTWLAVGRMVVQKDFPNMLRAFAPLRGRNWKLLIAGDGPLREFLESLARQLGLTEQVRFLGIRRDVPALHNAADALVLSSQMEGLPLAVLEASASGLPSVVTDVGGTGEAVLDGVTGFIVPPSDPQALSQALSKLMDLPVDVLRGFGVAARRRCLAQFEIETVVSRWETLYAKFLPGRTAEPKIFYAITRAERGGAQVHVQDLLGHTPAGCEPVLLTGEPGYLCDWARKRNIATRIVPSMRQPISPIQDFRALLDLIRLFRSERPTLVHAHTSKAGLLCRFAGLFTHTPVVFTAHTWSFADGISLFQRAITLPLERLAASRGGKIIAVSEANAQAARDKAVGKQEDLVTIWNGMPDSPLRAKPGSRHVRTVVMVARFAPQKNQQALVEALASVRMNNPWKLVLVGDGPTRQGIERLAASLGIQEKVDFLGDRGDVGKVLADSDLFVLSTNWEGLPLSILEAMRAGLPVIATAVGGCCEAVTDGVTGYLVSRNEAAELAGRIQTLLSSPDLLQAFGHAGRARFERDFRLETMIRKTWSVYESIVPELAFSGSLARLQSQLRATTAQPFSEDAKLDAIASVKSAKTDTAIGRQGESV